MRHLKRLLSIIIAVCLGVACIPATGFAAVEKDGADMTLTAASDQTITVAGPAPEPDTLQILSAKATIKRDYEQNCSVSVYNGTDEAAYLYLTAENEDPDTGEERYPDLAYQFIGNGSQSAPIFVAPGESSQITLSVFAQNAEHESYTIPVSAFVQKDEKWTEGAAGSVNLKCALPVLDLNWVMEKSESASLSQTWCVTNKGDAISDLTLSAQDALTDAVSFDPIISNFALEKGQSIKFTVQPDLAKMKRENLQKLEGQLCASGLGKSSLKPCSFDTEGKEIQVTTMGQLALQQSGNPYTKFDLVADSAVVQFGTSDGSFVDADKVDTAQTPVVGKDGSLQVKFDSNVDVGTEQHAKISIGFKATSITAEQAGDTNLDAVLSPGPTGFTVTTKQIITGDEYEAMLREAGIGQLPQEGVRSRIAGRESSSFEKGERYFLETTFEANDILEDLGGEGIPGIGTLSHVYDFCTTVEDISTGEGNGSGYGTAFAVVSNLIRNPNASTQAKINYAATATMKVLLQMGELAVDVTNPIIGTAFGLMTKPIDKMLDKMLDGYLGDLQGPERAKKLAEYYQKIRGQQCTNRGKVTKNFYAPSVGGNTKPTVHTSGRVYENGYIDKTETNYDITLNGEPAGTASNEGLTDVFMQEIPNTHLLTGKNNTIVFDYDTNPGSHSVTTENEITLLYPADTPVAFLDQPTNLKDVRTRPDFAVYAENIYTDADPIIGEQSAIHVNVYNLGSSGGWVTIVCSQESTEISKKENVYLDAFSKKRIDIPWTPSATEAAIDVTLQNTTVGLDERTTENNSAQGKMAARMREIPTVQPVQGKAYTNEPFELVVPLSQCRDFESIRFVYNGSAAASETIGKDSWRQCRVSFSDGLPKGEYSLKASITYRSSSGKTETTEVSVPFSVQNHAVVAPVIRAAEEYVLMDGARRQLEFTVVKGSALTRVEAAVDGGTSKVLERLKTDSDTESYAVGLSDCADGKHTVSIKAYYNDDNDKEQSVEKATVVNLVSEADSTCTFALSPELKGSKLTLYRGDSKEKVSFTQKPDGTCSFAKTSAMVLNPKEYYLCVENPGAVIVLSLDKIPATISTDGCRSLTATAGEANEIMSATISSLPIQYGTQADVPVSLSSPLKLSPGTYDLRVTMQVNGVSVERYFEIDVTKEDQTIDLSGFALSYKVDISKGGSKTYRASLYASKAESSWTSFWLDCLNKVPASDGTVLFYNDNEYAAKSLSECQQAALQISSKDELYIIPLVENGKPVENKEQRATSAAVITLDKATLSKVSVKPADDAWKVNSVSLEADHMTAFFEGSEFYVPKGTYTLAADISGMGVSYPDVQELTVDGDCTVVVGKAWEGAASNVTLKWAGSQTANVQFAGEREISFTDVSSEETLRVPEGTYSVFVTLGEGSGLLMPYSIDEFKASGDKTIQLGTRLTADIAFSRNDAGTAGEFEANEELRFRLQNIRDEYGNKFIRYYGLPLTGTVTYEAVSGGSKPIIKELKCENLNSLSAPVPDIPGSYRMSVQLKTKGEEATVVPTKMTVEITSSSVQAVSGTSVTMTANAADAPGDVTYTWSAAPEISGGTKTANTWTFTAPAVNTQQVYAISVTATAGNERAENSLSITVNPASTGGSTSGSTGGSGTGIGGTGSSGTGGIGTSTGGTGGGSTGSGTPGAGNPGGTLPGTWNPGSLPGIGNGQTGNPGNNPSNLPSSADPGNGSTAKPEITTDESSPFRLEIVTKPGVTGNILTGVPISNNKAETTVEQFYTQLRMPAGMSLEVRNPDGSLVSVGMPIATGQAVHVYGSNGQKIGTYTMLVMGDVTGTGRMQLTQLVRMARAYSGTDPLAGIYKLAALHTGRDDIALTDLVTQARMYREAARAA